MTVMPLHLGVEACGAQLQAVAYLLHLIEDLFGGLIRDCAPTSITKD
jgi:hypothetical protein